MRSARIEAVIEEGSVSPALSLSALVGQRLFANVSRVILGLILGFLFGVLLLHVIPHKYASSMTVRAPSEAGSQLSRGLASLLPDLPNPMSAVNRSDFDEYIAALTSMDLSNRIALRHPNVMHTIFKSEWDTSTQRWKPDTFAIVLHLIEQTIFASPKWSPPNGEDLLRYIKAHVDITQDVKSGMLTTSYANRDPVFARHFLIVLHSEADMLERERARARSESRVQYLSHQIQNVTQTDQHSALIQLLEVESRRLMMTQADKYFIALPVDNPAVSHTESWPPTYLVLLASVTLGCVISCFWICRDILRAFAKQELKEEPVAPDNPHFQLHS